MNLELARLDVKSSKSLYYPSISLTGSAGYQGQEQDYETMNQFNQGSGYNTSAGISLSYTIFDGNSRKRELDIARMERKISDLHECCLRISDCAIVGSILLIPGLISYPLAGIMEFTF